MGNNVAIKIVHYDDVDKEEFCKLRKIGFAPLLQQAGNCKKIKQLYYQCLDIGRLVA